MAIGLIMACDPMADIYEEMDGNPKAESADLDFILEDDDYELSGNEDAAKYKSFESVDEAKEGIPNILAEKYPHLGAPSSAIVGYDLYQGSVKYIYDDWKADYGMDVEDPIPTYTVTQDDYDAVLGEGNYGSFDNADDINTFLNMKYPDAWSNDGVELTYEYYSGSTNTVTANWSLHYGVWYQQNPLDSEAYAYMGRSSYFSSIDDAEYKVPIWITNTQFPYAKAGDRHMVQYTYKDYDDDKNYKPRLILNEYDGTEWLVVVSIVEAQLQCGHDGTEWVPDNTIKYTMTSDDYTAVSEAFAGSNPYGSASMANYGNYDSGLWSEDEIEESIGGVLFSNFPDSEQGQKYLVSFSVYTGTGETWTRHLILSGDTYVPVGGE